MSHPWEYMLKWLWILSWAQWLGIEIHLLDGLHSVLKIVNDRIHRPTYGI